MTVCMSLDRLRVCERSSRAGQSGKCISGTVSRPFLLGKKVSKSHTEYPLSLSRLIDLVDQHSRGGPGEEEGCNWPFCCSSDTRL